MAMHMGSAVTWSCVRRTACSMTAALSHAGPCRRRREAALSELQSIVHGDRRRGAAANAAAGGGGAQQQQQGAGAKEASLDDSLQVRLLGARGGGNADRGADNILRGSGAPHRPPSARGAAATRAARQTRPCCPPPCPTPTLPAPCHLHAAPAPPPPPQAHFDSIQALSERQALEDLLPRLRSALYASTDYEPLRERLRGPGLAPADKRALWGQLASLAFARAMGGVWLVPLLDLLVSGGPRGGGRGGDARGCWFRGVESTCAWATRGRARGWLSQPCAARLRRRGAWTSSRAG